MQVGILGPLEVRADGASIPLGGVRLRTLLIRLALAPDRPVSVEALSDAVWHSRSDAEVPRNGLHALHALISRLRGALPDGATVRSVEGGYRLGLAPEAVDAVRFEQLARSGRAELDAGRPDVAAARLGEALALWRGEALADVADAPFAAATIARLDEMRLTAIEDRARANLHRRSEIPQLVGELQALSSAHPARERVRELLIRALHADGRPAEALESYERFRATLAEKYGTDPSPELRQAHLAVLRDDGQPTASRRTNLRAEVTSFVGRRAERTLVSQRLTEARLVTLVGPGGVGKTRLAATVAADLVDATAAVWLVELGSVTDPGDVARTVLGVVGGRGGAVDSSRDPVDRLVHALSSGTALLVLDNCEHLLDATAALAEELLARCPSLTLLATSREPIGIAGEAFVPVDPLVVPRRGAPVEHFLDSSPVRLFADRARAARPDFAATAANVAVIADICRRLDGLPLAIELAAARVRTLPVEHLLERIDSRFTLLTGGGRTAIPRHGTLRAVVAWSWDLLEDEERLLMESLAVFAGPITLDAVENICATRAPVVDAVSALVDKSLLRMVDGPTLHYHMLETIREYALEALTVRGDADRIRRAHARYFLARAEAAAPHMRGPEQLRWIELLTAERGNLLGAWHFCCSTGDADTAVRLATALSFYLTVHGDHREAARLLRMALDLAVESGERVREPATAAYLLNAVLAGDVAPIAATIDRFRGAAKSGHPSSGVIEPLLAIVSGDTAAGLTAIDTSRPHPSPFARAMLCLVRSMLNSNAGDLGDASRDLAAAADLFEKVGERWGLVTSLTFLGIAQTMLGRPSHAIAALERSMLPARELGSDDYQRLWLATAHEYAGDIDTARTYLHQVAAGIPAARHLALARLKLADMARREGDVSAADRESSSAWRAVGAGGDSDAVFQALYRTASGRLALAAGDGIGGRRELRAAHRAAVSTSDMVLVAMVGTAVAELLAEQGELPMAAEMLGAAHALRGAADALHPDVAGLTKRLRTALSSRPFGAAYDRGLRLRRSAALEILEAGLMSPPGPR
ncbi:BTAD domain-containing putative transcriptional regulator [Rhodococcus daqingensis]|uniref:BTAD domain-containing putative transcriptional regulator n=1 Tax=Rhodococcus daqingensis TaxID=2479363 RepID=A0ABW2RTL3_9NOCA